MVSTPFFWIQSGQWICIRIRNLDPDPGGQKLPTKVYKKKLRNFMLCSAGCSLLRAEGFRIRIIIQPKRLDPNPYQMNTDQKHWKLLSKNSIFEFLHEGIQMFQWRSGRWCWFAARPATGAPPPSTWRSWAATATSRCESRPTTRRRRRYRTTTGRILRGRTRQWRLSQRPLPSRPVPVLVFQGGGGAHVFSAGVKTAVLRIHDSD